MILHSRKDGPHSNIPVNIDSARSSFPIFSQHGRKPKLVYLDSASTTQKPRSVIDAVVHYYSYECSNIHRGIHYLSERATESYEKCRRRVCRFLGAASENEIIFVRGATEGINLVAQTYGRSHVGPGDEILISAMEHHSNIVPWQILCEEKKARLRIIPIDETGELVLEEYGKLLGSKTKLVAVTHVSNVLGTVNPVADIIRQAHEKHIPVLIDGAQAAARQRVDVSGLDCDFYVFSGHKTYGPTGIGVLYGKEHILDSMPPYQGGGEMIRSVSFEKTEYLELPRKFEAGTPNIAGAVGLGAAIDFLESIGLDSILAHEEDLIAYTTAMLHTMNGIRILGSAKKKAGSVSFILNGVHPHDIATILDRQGIAIRAGHHCAQPLMDFYKIPASARVSFGVYNTRDDIQALINGLKTAQEVFHL